MNGCWKIESDHFWNKWEEKGLVLFTDVFYIFTTGAFALVKVEDGRLLPLTFNLKEVIEKMNTTGFTRTCDTHYAGLKHAKCMVKADDGYSGCYIKYAAADLIKCSHGMIPVFEAALLAYQLEQRRKEEIVMKAHCLTCSFYLASGTAMPPQK